MQCLFNIVYLKLKATYITQYYYKLYISRNTSDINIQSVINK